MSVLSHLTETASRLIITDIERTQIESNIRSLSSKLFWHFNSGVVVEKFTFGSFTRKTLMPRKADSKSDVDYMIVFSDQSYGTATYLRWLREFATARYPSSEIFQSYPTIVLELSRIKIELVPAIKSTYDSYMIPAPSTNYENWTTTHPNAFNTTLSNKNSQEKHLIRPLIRLMKYWNALNNYVYSSFELETLITQHNYYFCNNLWEYFESLVRGLTVYSLSNAKREKVDRLKVTVAETKRYLNENMVYSAETEIWKIIPKY